jgi:hypothetical protein
MAGKIPVGATVSRAYGFAFGNIVNNIGAIWMPSAIFYAGSLFLQKTYMTAVLSMSGNPQAAAAALPFIFGIIAVSFLLMSAQFAAITKEALGLRTGNAFLQFPFGAAMWRLLGAFLLYGLVMSVVYFGFILVSLVVMAVAAGIARGQTQGGTLIAAGLIGFGLVIVMVCAMIYIATRLSFLLAPVAVAERKVSLIRSWELTKGNFWRIFVIFLAVSLPFAVLDAVYIWAMYGTSLLPPMHVMTPQELQAFTLHQQQANRHAMEMTQRYWFVAYPAGLLVTVLFFGMLAGAAANAYRAVTHEDNSQEVF